jgi:LEA14-like dessication related protein
MRSKAGIWFGILVVLILGVLFFWQRSIILNYGKKGGSKPHLSIKRINVHDIGDDRISMTAQIMASNPLLIELNADKLEYDFFIDSVKIMETEFVKPISIKALDSVMLVLPIEIFRKNLIEVMDRFEENDADSADYTLEARLHFELPVAGEKTYVVNETQRGPAFRMLRLRTEDVDIEKFGFRNSDLSMSLIIENPNLFEISIRDVHYGLFIGKDFHMDGEVENIIRIPAGSTTSLPLEMDVQTKNIARLTWQVLFEKKHTPFHIDFACRIVATDDTFKDTRLQVKRSGKLDELKKALPEKGDPK